MIKIAIVFHSETGNTEAMAAMVADGCRGVEGVDEVRLLHLDTVDTGYLESCHAVILGCPNYEGCCSWQMKKFLDSSDARPLAGKLGGVFVTQNWPGGGGGSFAEMAMIAGMLVRGMLIYAGGITRGHPPVHFGAVARRIPEGIDRERAIKLGANIGEKAVELWGK